MAYLQTQGQAAEKAKSNVAAAAERLPEPTAR